MAIIYRAEIRPTKLELIGSWLPSQAWFGGRSVDGLASLGAYRFDDPAGEVGIETLLLDVAGEVVQVPMTYRGAPLAGAEEWLMGNMEHSVLGQRWVYDACADPVYASELAAAILQGGTQVEELVEGDGGRTLRASSVSVKGSGSPDGEVEVVGHVDDLTVSTVDSLSTISAPTWALEVRRIIDVNGNRATADPDLVATWAGQTEPVPLASGRRT